MKKRSIPVLFTGLVMAAGVIPSTPASAATTCTVSTGVIQIPTPIGLAIAGTAGNDTIDCSAYTATTGVIIDGKVGDDKLTGSPQGDVIGGGKGKDQIFGIGGNDLLTGPPDDGAVDKIDGGAGSDTCIPGGGDVLSNCP
jgi:Ca2+-binding RTX toxin-like protein